MDWKQLIAELAEAKLTQVRIAELCGVAQSTISDLARGASKSPTWELGDGLRKLHLENCGHSAVIDGAVRVPAPAEEAQAQGAA